MNRYGIDRMAREVQMRLFQQLHQNDEPEWRRASGSMKCSLCRCEYRYHPLVDEQLGFGEPIDHRLCDGDVVHL